MKHIDTIINDIPKVGIELGNEDNELDYVVDTRILLKELKDFEVDIPSEFNSIDEYINSLNNVKYIGGDNTYNHCGCIVHDINWHSYEINDKYYEKIMIHRGGDIRGNYTDECLLEFDYDTQFFEVVEEISYEMCSSIKDYNGKTYYLNLSPFSEYINVYCRETFDDFDIYCYDDTSFKSEIDEYYNEKKESE